MVFVIGMLMNLWFTRQVVGLGEWFVGKVPLVKTLYGSVKDLMSFFSSGDMKRQMGQVVTVQVADTRLLGFLTREDSQNLPAGIAAGADRAGQRPHDDGDPVAVYLPMSYQIGGFTVFVPKSSVAPVDMSVEDAMRFAVTAGVSSQEEPID